MAATSATPTWRAKSGSPRQDADPRRDLHVRRRRRAVDSGTAAVRSRVRHPKQIPFG